MNFLELYFQVVGQYNRSIEVSLDEGRRMDQPKYCVYKEVKFPPKYWVL